MMQGEISVKLAEVRKQKPLEKELAFGRVFTDHMFLMDYREGKGWHRGRIVPYGPIALDPAAQALHYGQTAFEGMKAHRSADDEVFLFRPWDHARRFNVTAERVAMPTVKEDVFVHAVRKLIEVDEEWLPACGEGMLYIRPFAVATEAGLGVRRAEAYLFGILLSPVRTVRVELPRPVSLYVEEGDVRAAVGGLGSVKTAANYAASLRAQETARENGCDQVLWLEARERRYVEEAGNMNVFFRIGETFHTPALNGSILSGITRDSVISLLVEWGFEVCERSIALEEVVHAAKSGRLQEGFGTGTAAGIVPIASLLWRGDQVAIPVPEYGGAAGRLFEALAAIQTGEGDVRAGWVNRHF